MTPEATTILDRISEPGIVQDLAPDELPVLASELRARILEVVSHNGGHLASNLGTIELTIALLRAFHPAQDRIIWDTGHQAYSYKLLTGRNQLFETLRQDGGCCGFLHRQESAFDYFGAGHAGTAISAALGFAAARDQAGENHQVVAVLGDGALGCGSSLEGLNSIIETTRNFILVINDNKMSIAPNVGALSLYLSRAISGQRYQSLKKAVAAGVDAIPLVGRRLHRWSSRMILAAKGMLTPGSLFEELGLTYIGPIDGHDIAELEATLKRVRKLDMPIVVHVLTEKGHGYPHATRRPEQYHGMGQFEIDSGTPVAPPSASDTPPVTFSGTQGDSLLEIMRQDRRVVAITAGMCHGTGLLPLRQHIPERLYDVGIAEEHAVVLAAGMAAAGLKPVVAVYATFMQRAMDYVFHDVCLQDLPVVFCLDRSGVVDDGPTHHGILDLAFWRVLPNLLVAQPADADEHARMLRFLLDQGSPAILRYPKGDAAEIPELPRTELALGKAEIIRAGTDVGIWAVGREVATALKVADRLAERGIQAAVINPRFLLPFDIDLATRHARDMPMVVIEDHSLAGGFTSLLTEALHHIPGTRILGKGWPREYIPWGTVNGLRDRFGMTPGAIAQNITAFLGESPQ